MVRWLKHHAEFFSFFFSSRSIFLSFVMLGRYRGPKIEEAGQLQAWNHVLGRRDSPAVSDKDRRYSYTGPVYE